MYWARKYFTDPGGHWAAFYEVAITAIFSLTPFYIAYFVRSAKSVDGHLANMDDLLGRGQLFLLAYGIYGAVFWLAFIRGDKARHSARAFLGLVATILIFPVIGFLGVDPTFSTVLNAGVIRYGYILYTSLLIIQYLLLFYINIEPPTAADVFSREANDMRARYESMAGGTSNE